MSSTLIDRTTMTGVSPSLVKALDSESSIRRFESYYPCQSSYLYFDNLMTCCGRGEIGRRTILRG